MSGSDVLRVLSERQPACALGVSWLSPAVLRDLTRDNGVQCEDEMLEAVVEALGCDMAFVDADCAWATDAAARLLGCDVVVGWSTAGLLGRVAADKGLADVIKMSAVKPDALLGPLDAALQDVLRDVGRGCTAGAEVVVIADDLAGPSGWLVSPDFVLEVLMPRYSHAAAAVVDAGAVPVFHSDGDTRALYPSFASARFAGLHVGGADGATLQAASPAAAASDLALLGGVRVAGLIPQDANRIGSELAAMAWTVPIVICDDGGIDSTDDVWAYALVLDAVRRSRTRA